MKAKHILTKTMISVNHLIQLYMHYRSKMDA